jgi:hypothetical protein
MNAESAEVFSVLFCVEAGVWLAGGFAPAAGWPAGACESDAETETATAPAKRHPTTAVVNVLFMQTPQCVIGERYLQS